MYSIIENGCKVNYYKYFCQLGDVGKAQSLRGEGKREGKRVITGEQARVSSHARLLDERKEHRADSVDSETMGKRGFGG